jgi:uncharacterized OsmC-like protein
MENVNTKALEETAAQAVEDPASARQQVSLAGEWQHEEGAPQFRGTIPYPGGEVEFTCDFPPPLGGSGAAPNPLAYCFWGGLACYAMTYALEAAREGVELTALRATVAAEVDLARALGVSERPPVEGIDWTLEVEADAEDGVLERLKALADERCPGAYCVRNPIPLDTRVVRAGKES